MFGREYASYSELLTQSFGEINDSYKDKLKKERQQSFLLKHLQRLYILLFGIPEIGFQIRNLYFADIVNTYLSNKKFNNILDAGSGIGAYTFLLAKTFQNASVFGVDIDKYKLKTSETIGKDLNIENVQFAYMDLMASPRKKITYDCIVTIDVLEHVEKYESVLKNFSRMLKKNGYLYIHVPQPEQKRIFKVLETWHHHDHVREGLTKNELSLALKKLDFKIIIAKETYGFFGKLAWEINHLLLSKSFILAGITFPILYAIALLDLTHTNKNGLGVALLAQKK